MAQRGCNVIISGRRRDALESTAAGSTSIRPHAGDITDAAHRAELCAGLAVAEAPRAIFHGAGYFQVGLLAGLSDDDWARSFATNVTARWQLSRDCAELLVGGRVLFIGSDAGLNPRPAAAAYSIAQSASETLRRSLQAEWGDRDIAVAGFKPGLVDTDMVRGFMSLPIEQFPSRAAYEEYVSSGKIVGPEPIVAPARRCHRTLRRHRMGHPQQRPPKRMVRRPPVPRSKGRWDLSSTRVRSPSVPTARCPRGLPLMLLRRRDRWAAPDRTNPPAGSSPRPGRMRPWRESPGS